MEITVELIFALVTAIVTGILGIFLKDNVIPARFIPIQNMTIGIISSIVAITMGLFPNVPVAILTCLAIAMGVGGTYDLVKTKK